VTTVHDLIFHRAPRVRSCVHSESRSGHYKLRKTRFNGKVYGRKTGSASAGPTGSRKIARLRPPLPRDYTKLWEPRPRRTPCSRRRGLTPPELSPRVYQGPPALVLRGVPTHSGKRGFRKPPRVQRSVLRSALTCALHVLLSSRRSCVSLTPTPLVWSESELEAPQHYRVALPYLCRRPHRAVYPRSLLALHLCGVREYAALRSARTRGDKIPGICLG
jgi:hypothetical protein